MPVFIKPLVRLEMDNYVDGFGNKRNWRKNRDKNLSVKDTITQPAPAQNTMIFRALVKSEVVRDPHNDIGPIKTSNKKNKKTGERDITHPKKKHDEGKVFINYLVTIKFFDVQYRESSSLKFSSPFMVDGESIFAKIPNIKENKCQLKCQCRDFQMVWEKALAEQDGLWPNSTWTKYTRVSPASNLPPRNPMEKMGYCKHIQNLLEYLYDNEMIGNV